MKIITPITILVLVSMCESASCGVLTDRDLLYTDIFTNYSAKTLPVLNHTDTVFVKVNVYISNINSFDELSGDLSVTVSMLLEWKEERISWNPSDYNGITSISVIPGDLWRPQMFLLESSDSVKDLGNTSIKPTIYSNGAVLWNNANVLKVACSVDVEYFPYDEQRCEMTILNWDMMITDVMYYPGNSVIQQTHFKANSQWELASGELRNCTTTPLPCFNLLFVFNRRSEFYLIYIIIPLIFLSLINNLVFLMPPTSGERTSVAVTAFLSFIVYMDIVNDVVPQSSDPVAYIFYYILFLMVYSCTVLFLCIVSLRIYDRQTEVPKWLQTLIYYMRLRFLRTAKVNDEVMILKRQKSTNEGQVEDVLDKTKGNLTTEEFGQNALNVASDTVDSFTANDSAITWFTVGHTFDVYCFIILYAIDISFTAVSVIKIANNNAGTT